MLDGTQFLIDYIPLGAKRGKNSLTHTDLRVQHSDQSYNSGFIFSIQVLFSVLEDLNGGYVDFESVRIWMAYTYRDKFGDLTCISILLVHRHTVLCR